MDWITAATKQVSSTAIERALARQNTLTKPPGSLGQLEALAVRLAGMKGQPPAFNHPAIVVFAGDHGVADEGVSAFPQAVTGEMVRNFANGGAAICVLAKAAGASLEVVNLGTVNDPGALPGVVNVAIAPATANMVKQAAMSVAQLATALAAGRDAVIRALQAGADIFVGGDMGIANTTAASALACVFLDQAPTLMAGPGTGLDREGIKRKAQVIDRALAMHSGHLDNPVDVLQRLGGFEIAALAGAMIAAAQQGLPFVVDGYIASSAALTAIRINPGVGQWLLLSHASAEPGYKLLGAALAAETGMAPLLDLGMRLGEGSGAALVLPLISSACMIHNEMATFADAGVSDGE